MASRRLLRAGGLAVVWMAGAAVLGGCGMSYTERTLAGQGVKPPTGGSAEVKPELINSARLRSTPDRVRLAFGDAYPGASVEQVAAEAASDGMMLYRITYLEDGRPGVVTYRADGSEVGAEDAGVIERPDPGAVRVKRLSAPTSTQDYQ